MGDEWFLIVHVVQRSGDLLDDDEDCSLSKVMISKVFVFSKLFCMEFNMCTISKLIAFLKVG